MADASIRAFISRLHESYGTHRIEPYGSAAPEQEHGFGFKVRGAPAVFSVITLDGSLPFGRYSIQVESDPPGEYLFTDQLETAEAMKLIARVVAGERP